MNILIVSSYLPYPLFDGGNVRLYNIIKELSKRHKITLIAEIRQHQGQTDIDEVKKYCEDVIVIPHTKPWSFQNILRTGFSSYPLLLVMHTFPQMKKKIVEILNTKRFDVIHVETFYVYQNLPKTYLPVVLVEHNIEYLVYTRYAQTAKPFLRPFLYADIVKLKYWEEKFWKKATILCAVTEEEKRKMVRDNVAVVPNGVDTHIYKLSKSKETKTKKVLFIGSFKWIQNVNSAKWIINEIWPKVVDQISRKKLAIKPMLWIVGRNIPEDIKALKTDSIIFEEHADDTVKVYQQADILLAPIKVGGGSSYKIIEAMASGVPVVTTKLAADALGARHDAEIMIGEEAEVLADNVLELLQNPMVYEKIKKNARVLIENKYNWEAIAKTLEKAYEHAVKES